MDNHRSCRIRKQRLLHRQDFYRQMQMVSDVHHYDGMSSSLDERSPPRRLHRPNNSQGAAEIRDRQAQLDHNEQERERRRELTMLYEMIRTCVTSADVQNFVEDTTKPLDRLSHPMLLQIGYNKVVEELHDYNTLDSLILACNALEEECRKRNIPFNERPRSTPILRRHKITADIVKESLMNDKE